MSNSDSEEYNEAHSADSVTEDLSINKEFSLKYLSHNENLVDLLSFAFSLFSVNIFALSAFVSTLITAVIQPR